MSDRDSQMSASEIAEFFDQLQQKATVNKIAQKMSSTHENGGQLPDKKDPELTPKMIEAKNIKEDFIKEAEQRHVESMSLVEAEEKLRFEEMENDQNSIYKINARVKNLARKSGAKLTDQGIAMCNLYTHVLKSLYKFADNIDDKELRKEYVELVRSHENLPGHIIVSLHLTPGVTNVKNVQSEVVPVLDKPKKKRKKKNG